MDNHLKSVNALLLAIKEPELAVDIAITGLENHSGRVQTGYVFIAYKGSASDGKAYITQAIEHGAAVVLVDEITEAMQQLSVPVIKINNLSKRLGEIASAFWLKPSKSLKIVGITATNGKTTTAYLMAQMLQYLGHRALLIGTLGIGELSNLAASQNTTPDALQCQALFARCVQEGIDWVVMEVSSIAVEQGRIEGIDFELSVFLNLTQDHLDYHGTMLAYAGEKKRFIESYGTQKLVNADDEIGQQMLKANSNIIDFGLAAKAYKQLSSELSLEGVQVEFECEGQKYAFSAPLLGEFNVQNLAAVYIGLLLLGFDAEELVQITPKLRAPSGRVELFKHSRGAMAIVDYAHTPDALEKLLETVNPLVNGQVVLIVGCGGNRDKEKRPLMAKIAEDNANKIWFTADNPRFETPQSIIDDMLKGVAQPRDIIVELNRRLAIELAAKDLGEDDVLVVAGKGHEQYQEIEGVRTDFSDQAVLESLGFKAMEVA